MDEFNECCRVSSLDDLRFSRQLTTWSKGSSGDFKARKLDRALVNSQWHIIFPDAEAIFQAPGASDHSPVLIFLGLQKHIRRPPFRYFSYWAEHPMFEAIVSAAWNTQMDGSYQFCVARKLKILKAELKTLNNTEYANLANKTDKARITLQIVQRNLLLQQGNEELKAQEILTLENLI